MTHQTTVTLEGISKRSRLTTRALFPSAKAHAFVINKYGAIEGMNQHLGRL